MVSDFRLKSAFGPVKICKYFFVLYWRERSFNELNCGFEKFLLSDIANSLNIVCMFLKQGAPCETFFAMTGILKLIVQLTF